MDPVRLEVWSDYLCPWCYVAAHRLARVQAEFGEDALALRWRSYLLRPRPAPRDRDVFVRYTRSWERPAAEPDAPRFRVWEGDEGPPTHSVPPHAAAKAAARLGPAAFRALHGRLLRAYFAESRDITRTETLRALWADCGLDPAAGEAASDGELVAEVQADHAAALERGITGVPAVAVAGREGWVLGAQPLAIYRRWVERLRAEEGA